MKTEYAENEYLTLSPAEIEEITDYTIQKINSYPKEYKKTVENYFDLLFPDEVHNYILRREINRQGRQNYEKQQCREETKK